MHGFVVQNEKGEFLDSGLAWYHDCVKDAWVYSADAIGLIRKIAPGWETKPVRIYPATWTKESGTTITGTPITF